MQEAQVLSVGVLAEPNLLEQPHCRVQSHHLSLSVSISCWDYEPALKIKHVSDWGEPSPADSQDVLLLVKHIPQVGIFRACGYLQCLVQSVAAAFYSPSSLECLDRQRVLK